MENHIQSTSDDDILSLRDDIKRKYRTYHDRDRDRYPAFDFNTSRANYESLRASIEEELYTVRGIDRGNAMIHVPSTNTLALLFTDDTYVPGRKILNACRSYAYERPVSDDTETPTVSTKSVSPARPLWYAAVGMLLMAAVIGIYSLLRQASTRLSPTGLAILAPLHGQVVPRLPFVSGRVANADTVWILVRPVALGAKCYVQPPIPVKEDGTWRGQIFVGGVHPANIGMAFEIRAFVNPPSVFQAVLEEERDIFDLWPSDADLSTYSTVVIRGAEPVKPAK